MRVYRHFSVALSLVLVQMTRESKMIKTRERESRRLPPCSSEVSTQTPNARPVTTSFKDIALQVSVDCTFFLVESVALLDY